MPRRNYPRSSKRYYSHRTERKKRKSHNRYIYLTILEPSQLKIEGLTAASQVLATLVEPTFSTDKKNGKEKGDLHLLWETESQKWELVVIELTTSQYRHSQRDYLKLKKTQEWLKDNWQTVLNEMKLRLPAGFNLASRMISVSFATGEASVIETKVIKLT